MTRSLTTSVLAVGLLLAGWLQANAGHHRGGGCCSTGCAVSACQSSCGGCQTACAAPACAPAPAPQYVDRVVTKYKQEMVEQEVTVCRMVQKEEKYTCTVMVPKTVQEQRTITVCKTVQEQVPYTCTVMVPKTVQDQRTIT
jgi:hypothetical protein